MAKTKKLKDYRNASGLTQEVLAQKSNISIRTIQRIEKGLATGSPYTLKQLAEVLKIDDWKLLHQDSLSIEQTDDADLVKMMNLSSLAVLILPLSNLIFPLILFLKQKDKISLRANRILSFQLLWLLVSMLLMLLLPILLMWIVDSLHGSKVPLFIPVYYLSVAVNLYFIITTAIKLNNNEEILTFVPSIF